MKAKKYECYNTNQKLCNSLLLQLNQFCKDNKRKK